MRETITFVNSRGARLAGYWEVPHGNNGLYPAIVFAHGMGSGKGSPRDEALARELLAGGIISLRFDFTGHGDSEGTIEQATPDQQTDDLLWAIDYAMHRPECSGSIGLNAADTGALPALKAALADLRLSALVLRSHRVDGLLQHASMINIPTLIITGTNDRNQQACKDLYDQLKVQKELAIVTGAGHLFEEPGALEKMVRQSAEWFVEHLVPIEVKV